MIGDPVDVVTGANFFEVLDFRLVGPLPLLWHRAYNSALSSQRLAFGWGHTHGLDHTLKLDLDGISYQNPMRDVVGFPPLDTDGDVAAVDGLIVERLSEYQYALHEEGQPSLDFTFGKGDPVGRLTALRRDEDAIRLVYSAERLSSLTDSLGRHIRVEYDPDGRLIGLVLVQSPDKENRSLVRYRYDEAGNLVEAIDPYRNRTQHQYDAHHPMTRRVDRGGYAFHYEYDTEGRCTRCGGADGAQEVRLQYESARRLTRVTLATGGEWQYFHDGSGAVTQVIDPYGGIYSFNYDETGRLIQEVDPNQNARDITYDENGAPLIEPASSPRFIGPPPFYEPAEEEAETPESASPLEWEYGVLANQDALGIPSNVETSRFEIPADLLSLVRRSTVAEQCQSVDAPGCLQPEPTGEGTPVDQQVQREGDDYGVVFHRNEQGLIYREKFADGTSRRWTYDANGNIKRYADREGARYSYEYASWDQLVRFTDPLARSVTYEYNPMEELAGIVDAGGTASRYTYDLKNRLTHIYRDGVLKEEYRYDQADNLVEKLDGKGNTLLKIEVGPENREAAVRLASGDLHEFSYDESGRVIRAATNGCQVVCEYDIFGLPISDQQNGLGVRREPTESGGERVTVLGKFPITYETADDGTLIITDPAGKSHSIRILDDGLFHRRTASGTEELAQFDRTGRCLFKAAWREGAYGWRWIREYDYSREGDLVGVRDNKRGEDRYTYDAAHQLVGWERPNGERKEFQYDAAGNLLKHPELDNASIAEGNRLVHANGERFQYNDRNDVSVREHNGQRTEYDYDSLDMLASVRSSSGKTRFVHDALGRRISKSHNGKITRFVWDGDRLAAEIDPGGRVRLYVYPNALALVPLLFLEYESLDADPQSGTRYYVFTNQIGTPTRVEDERGTAVWSATISPYGTAHVDSGGGFHMPLRFPGHYFDQETGLHYNRFRYYDSRLGRYIQADPDGVGGGLNVYAYTAATLVQVDVDGLGCRKKKKKANKKKRPRKESTKWGKYLTTLKGSHPPGMKRPHAHHIVMKKGNPKSKEMQKHLRESRKILREAGIDLWKGPENLVWAPNKGHSIAYAKKVNDELKATSGSKRAVTKTLDSIGKRLANGTF